MKIILVLCVAIVVIPVLLAAFTVILCEIADILLAAFTVILCGIADILPDIIEAIDKMRARLKKRREEAENETD